MSPTPPSPLSNAPEATSTFVQYAKVVAPKHQLPVVLVAAIIRVESAGNPYAWRCEPDYRYLYDVAKHAAATLSVEQAAMRLPPAFFKGEAFESDLTEWIGQQSSWGLMQVMGAVARQLGYTGAFPGLCMPMDGIEYGCRNLANLRDTFFKVAGWRGVVSSYNAGSPRFLPDGKTFRNQDYVDKVTAAGGFEGLP